MAKKQGNGTKKLLERAAEEFGFSNHGRIVLPCDEAAFYIMVSDIAENEGA
ncbi:auxin-induced protein 15A [Tripterygium wilfordii]|uniref:Auxin-induced protein 15A n=1 Tax=Tripterygium wilfordii TaxID=458696 RepID=A0A7J7DFJ7_TRIWF|nr:auxin-induced protein 15A [Tripterygium wilfordii]